MNIVLNFKTIRPASLLMVLLCVSFSYSQTLKKPVLKFSAPCVSATFNTFEVDFDWSTPLVNSGNSFILELSDANGSFTNAQTLSTVTNRNTTLKFTFQFAFPVNVSGKNYKVRVRSTNPARTSPESDPFQAYYLKVNESLVLNNYQDVVLCQGGSTTLQIDNYPNEASYNWYRNVSLIAGEHGPTLTTDQPGLYFVEVDYGDYCSTSTASNIVEVTVSNLYGIDLIGPTDVTMCKGQIYTLEANVNDNTLTYNWYKDNVLIAKNNNYRLQVDSNVADFEGEYFVELGDAGQCKEASSVVTIAEKTFDLSTDVTGNNIFLSGNTYLINATTSAISPKYQWYKDGVMLSGEKSAQLMVNAEGTYKVEVEQTVGCNVLKYSEDIVFISPTSFTATLSARSDYVSCQSVSTDISISKITATTSMGTTLDMSATEMAKFNISWYKNGQQMTGMNQESMTVSDYTGNADYYAMVERGGITATSNSMKIQLRMDMTVSLSSDIDVYCSTPGTITADVSDANLTYKWYKDNALLPDNTSSISVNGPGVYRLELHAGGCSISSNEITIQQFDESQVTLNSPVNIVIPEDSSKTLTASGADFYEWYDSLGNQISASDTVTLYQAGQYYLTAYVGDCSVTMTITVEWKEIFEIPNVITPNGDGYNDLWILPNAYANRADITVLIYDQLGKLVMSKTAYQNDWPSSSLNYSSNRPIFYYKVVNGKEILKQGTITLIR